MRIIAVLLCLGFSKAAAQDSIGSSTVLPAPGAAWLLDWIWYRSAQLKLGDLRDGPPAPADAELRLWHGFGLTGVDLVVFRHESGAWRVSVAHLPDRGQEVRFRADTSSTPAAARWQNALDAGLRTLPLIPGARPGDMVTTDGFGAVLEWWEAGRYRAATADHPDVYCTTNDRRAVAVIEALLGHEWPRTPGACKT